MPFPRALPEGKITSNGGIGRLLVEGAVDVHHMDARCGYKLDRFVFLVDPSIVVDLGVQVKVVRGDLVKLAFDGRFDVIIHDCNCQCVMGARIAKAIKQAFTEAYKADQAT
jgi:hypothetical protein